MPPFVRSCTYWAREIIKQSNIRDVRFTCIIVIQRFHMCYNKCHKNNACLNFVTFIIMFSVFVCWDKRVITLIWSSRSHILLLDNLYKTFTKPWDILLMNTPVNFIDTTTRVLVRNEPFDFRFLKHHRHIFFTKFYCLKKDLTHISFPPHLTHLSNFAISISSSFLGYCTKCKSNNKC